MENALFDKCEITEKGRLVFDGVFVAQAEKMKLSLFEAGAPARVAFVNMSVDALRRMGIVGLELVGEGGRIYTEEYIRSQEDYSEKGRLNKPGLELALSAYRGLRLNYETTGRFPEASKFYIREMHLKRALEIYGDYHLIEDFWQKLWREIRGDIRQFWFLQWFYGIWSRRFWRWIRYDLFSFHGWYRRISSYGESYGRAMWWLLGVWLFFVLIHQFAGIEGLGYEYYIFGRFQPVPPGEFIHDFALALVYSLKSLIPGTASLYPRSTTGWTSFFTVVEGVLGAVVITLFLLAVRRRFRR